MLNKSEFCKFLYCSFRSVTGKHLFRRLLPEKYFQQAVHVFVVEQKQTGSVGGISEHSKSLTALITITIWWWIKNEWEAVLSCAGNDLIKCRCANMWFSRKRWGYTPVGCPYRKEREQPEARCSQNIYCNIKHLEVIVGIRCCINKI